MLVELKSVRKTFPSTSQSALVKAVDGVDLLIKPGENLGLVGESGSGKTTLGRLILKLYDADSGTVIVDGNDWTRISSRRLRALRKSVGVVFQDPYNSLDPRFSVRAVLSEALIGQELSKARIHERMAKILRSVGLGEDALERFPHEFSGGERQRIAIARALLSEPKLLILDEAVSSLDVLIAAQILELLQDLQKKFDVTYLFITHNLKVVRKICHRIAVMYSGRIVEIGPTNEILQNPLHPYTQELLAAALSYKTAGREFSGSCSENSRLIDHGNAHFVLE